jgi:hypothetical protein
MVMTVIMVTKEHLEIVVHLLHLPQLPHRRINVRAMRPRAIPDQKDQRDHLDQRAIRELQAAMEQLAAEDNPVLLDHLDLPENQHSQDRQATTASKAPVVRVQPVHRAPLEDRAHQVPPLHPVVLERMVAQDQTVLRAILDQELPMANQATQVHLAIPAVPVQPALANTVHRLVWRLVINLALVDNDITSKMDISNMIRCQTSTGRSRTNIDFGSFIENAIDT